MAAQLADLNNVQGDILIKLPKIVESFLFFEINRAQIQKFRQQLGHLIPLITTAAQGQQNLQKVMNFKRTSQRGGAQNPMGGKPLLTITGINISFSQKGLHKLGINDILDGGITADDIHPFRDGMLQGANGLGDDLNEWLPEFKNREVDGVVLVTGDSEATVNRSLAIVHDVFSIDTLEEIITLTGKVRPGLEQGHEHFGFQDGVSLPAIEGIDTSPNPGQETVPQGIVLTLRDGDNGIVRVPNPVAEGVRRPLWTRDGSFLTFRKLQQKVPEFNMFMKANSLHVQPGLNNPTGAEFLAARLVGRWPSGEIPPFSVLEDVDYQKADRVVSAGAPLDITPLRDDPTLGSNAMLNDNFFFTAKNPDDQTSQERCPFAAHIRKSNPRGDLANFGGTTVRRIVRRGIQYGPELTTEEISQNRTIEDRGLLFACYQSNIGNGFQFIQQSWVNTPGFPPQKPVIPGLDALIGMPTTGSNGVTTVRQLSGTNPQNPNAQLPFFQWVVPQGGEYFFSPSISALKEVFVGPNTNL